MSDQSFLNKLKRDGKLELVEPSEEMKESQLQKAEACLTSAKVLLPHELYENSIVNSYYTMYNALTALLFKVGIKCENHEACIILFRRLFNKPDLSKIIVFGKEERIDKQYYPTSKDNLPPTEQSTKDMIIKAEDFLVKIKLLITQVNNEDISKIRKNFDEFFENNKE